MGYAPALLPIYCNEENDDSQLFFGGTQYFQTAIFLGRVFHHGY
jgi:hypothetical protein